MKASLSFPQFLIKLCAYSKYKLRLIKLDQLRDKRETSMIAKRQDMWTAPEYNTKQHERVLLGQ